MMQTVEPLGSGEKDEAKGEAMQPFKLMHTAVRGMHRGGDARQIVQASAHPSCWMRCQLLLLPAKKWGCRGGPHLQISSKPHLGRGPARVIEPQHGRLGHPRLSQRGAQQVGRVVLRRAEQQTGGGMGRQELQRTLH